MGPLEARITSLHCKFNVMNLVHVYLIVTIHRIHSPGPLRAAEGEFLAIQVVIVVATRAGRGRFARRRGALLVVGAHSVRTGTRPRSGVSGGCGQVVAMTVDPHPRSRRRPLEKSGLFAFRSGIRRLLLTATRSDSASTWPLLAGIMIQTFSRACDPRVRTEGRGCDTVLFGDRSHDRVVGSDNHPHVVRSRCRQVEKILLGQRRGGCRYRWRCGCLRRVRCWNGLRLRDLRDLSRIDGLDGGVSPDELARADTDPGDGRGIQRGFKGCLRCLSRPDPTGGNGLAPAEPAESGMELNGSVVASAAAKVESSSAVAGRLSSRPGRSIHSQASADIGVADSNGLRTRLGCRLRRSPPQGCDED